jgi:uncharacterized phage-like protein YoqJ
MKTLCFTGHRRLPRPESDYHVKLKEVILRSADNGFGEFISGGAVGIDQIAAQQVLKLKLYLIIAKPFPSQDKVWPAGIKQRFERICKSASELVHVSPDPYTPAKMQIRNEWMVDHSDVVIAVFGGSSGGTANCVKYARDSGKRVLKIDAMTLEETWM